MLHDFAVGESKQVIEGGMDAAVVALADAKDEVPLGQDTMNALIVSAPAAFALDFQRGSENGRAISKSRIVLGEGVFIDKIVKPIDMPIDEHDFNER